MGAVKERTEEERWPWPTSDQAPNTIQLHRSWMFFVFYFLYCVKGRNSTCDISGVCPPKFHASKLPACLFDQGGSVPSKSLLSCFFYNSGLRRNDISQWVTNLREPRTRCAVEESQHFVPPRPPLLSPDVLLSAARVMVQYLANAGQGAVLDDGATIHGGDFVSSKQEQAKGRWV